MALAWLPPPVSWPVPPARRVLRRPHRGGCLVGGGLMAQQARPTSGSRHVHAPACTGMHRQARAPIWLAGSDIKCMFIRPRQAMLLAVAGDWVWPRPAPKPAANARQPGQQWQGPPQAGPVWLRLSSSEVVLISTGTCTVYMAWYTTAYVYNAAC